MPINLTCYVCGSTFTVKPYRAKKARYCSLSCAAKDRDRAPAKIVEHTCKQCGKSFMVPLWKANQGGGVYCSKACMSLGYVGSGHHQWKGGRVVDAQGYVRVYAPDHPNANSNGYVLEHRLVMSRHMGRPLREDEVVHHMDEDPGNNEISNLMVMNPAEHALLHATNDPRPRGDDGQFRSL